MSWMVGARLVSGVPLQPSVILTGMTLPALATLYWPKYNGGCQAPSEALTVLVRLAAAEVPPSLSLAVALTLWLPHAEKVRLAGLPVAAAASSIDHFQVNPALVSAVDGSVAVPLSE